MCYVYSGYFTLVLNIVTFVSIFSNREICLRFIRWGHDLTQYKHIVEVNGRRLAVKTFYLVTLSPSVLSVM